MTNYQLGEVESRFAEIIWREEPISSPELVRICESELNWKKSTTYTVLRKLCQRGIFKNENGVVTSLISKEDFSSSAGKTFLDETFGGSLPAFIASFTAKNRLTAEEVEEIRRLIDEYGEK